VPIDIYVVPAAANARYRAPEKSRRGSLTCMHGISPTLDGGGIMLLRDASNVAVAIDVVGLVTN